MASIKKPSNWKVMVQPLLAMILGLWQWGRAGADQPGHPAGAARHRQPALVPRAGSSAGAGEAAAFLERQQVRNAERLAADPAEVKLRPYTGRPHLLRSDATSLLTVLCGLGAGDPDRHPCGVLLGMNQGLYRAANPVIQLLKPGVAAGLAAPHHPGGERPLCQPHPWQPRASPSSPRPDGDPLLPLADPDQHGGGVAGLDGDLHNVSRVLRLRS